VCGGEEDFRRKIAGADGQNVARIQLSHHDCTAAALIKASIAAAMVALS
jgi:hypothetical protein